MPEVKLGDYKKIAKNVFKDEDPVDVTEKEIEDVIKNLRQNVAHAHMHEKEGLDEHNHDHGEIKDEDLPEIDEAFLKQIGDFASVEDLKNRIKENLLKEKTFKAHDKKRTSTSGPTSGKLSP